MVDGADQQIITVSSMQLYEVAPYYALTGQYHLMLGMCVNTNWFNALPEDLQQILLDAAAEGGEYAASETNEATDAMLTDMEAKGLVVRKFTEDELKEWKDAAESFYDKNPEYKEWRASLREAIEK